MNLMRLVLRNILNRPFRSIAVLASAALVTAGASLASIVLQGVMDLVAQSTPDINELQVDIVVLPRAGSARFLSQEDVDASHLLDQIASIPEVAEFSPQQRLTIAEGVLQEEQVELIAFDPATDFTILPQLLQNQSTNLTAETAILGSGLGNIQDGAWLTVGGHSMTVFGHLPATGTAQDRTLYISFAGAQRLLQELTHGDERLLESAAAEPPMLLVQVREGVESHEVAQRILEDIQGVSVYDHSDFLGPGRERLNSLSRLAPMMLAGVWMAATAAMVIVTKVLSNAHEWEVSVLRALGAPRPMIVQWLSGECLLLVFGGALAGSLLAMALAAAVGVGSIALSGVPSISLRRGQVPGLLGAGMTATLAGVLLASLSLMRRQEHRYGSTALKE